MATPRPTRRLKASTQETVDALESAIEHAQRLADAVEVLHRAAVRILAPEADALARLRWSVLRSVDVGRSASDELLRSHNVLHEARGEWEALVGPWRERRANYDQRVPEPDREPELSDALTAEDAARERCVEAGRRRRRARDAAELALDRVLYSSRSGRETADRSARRILTLLSHRLGEPATAPSYRLLLSATRDAAEKELIFEFLFALAEVAPEDRGRAALEGLREIPRSRFSAWWSRLLGRSPQDDILRDLRLAEDDSN